MKFTKLSTTNAQSRTFCRIDLPADRQAIATDAQDGSVTAWISGLKQGEEDAARRLFDRYSDHVSHLALAALKNAASAPVCAEDDIVQEVFFCLMRGAAQGRFPRLTDREDLSRLLLVLTQRRTADQLRHDSARKRGGRHVRDEQALHGTVDASTRGLAALISQEPTPEDAAIIGDTIRNRFGQLNSELRRIALMKLEQHTNQEIAIRLNLSLTTVERKLRRIRSIWSREPHDA